MPRLNTSLNALNIAKRTAHACMQLRAYERFYNHIWLNGFYLHVLYIVFIDICILFDRRTNKLTLRWLWSIWEGVTKRLASPVQPIIIILSAVLWAYKWTFKYVFIRLCWLAIFRRSLGHLSAIANNFITQIGAFKAIIKSAHTCNGQQQFLNGKAWCLCICGAR